MNGDLKPDIRDLDLAALVEFLGRNGEQAYRARQVYEWLWKKGARNFDAMTSLPARTRNILSEAYHFSAAGPGPLQVSRDGTVKTLFSMMDGATVEGVLIPSAGRTTACISSQAGCALGCTFCATGRLGLTRNLSAGEIFDQVFLLNGMSLDQWKTPLSNIVLMGMGEPLMNYREVTRAIGRMTAPDGLGISPQRITLSTVGIPKGIRQLADDGVKCYLALSLHAATDAKRNRIIPVNQRFPLAEVTDALKYYHQKTRKRFTIEYILFRNVNDSESDARDLAHFCKSFPVKINLIEYNDTGTDGFTRSDDTRTRAFSAFLEKKNLVVNIRKSRGKDISAACGQLAGTSLPDGKRIVPKDKPTLPIS